MTQTGGYLTTHVLDTARGVPARGIAIALYRIEAGERRPLGQAVTNADGRTDAPLVPKGSLEAGTYELVFAVGDYFRANRPADGPPFLDVVPVRFGICDPQEHVHVPLLVSGFGYSTYKGS